MTVKNKSPCFFGHFGIAITAAAMYSPFIYQTLLGFAYIIAMALALVFEAWKFERLLIICIGSKNTLDSVSYICNIGLITSAVTGVGMSNWDPYDITCYYTKLGMWYLLHIYFIHEYGTNSILFDPINIIYIYWLPKPNNEQEETLQSHHTRRFSV